MSGYTRVRGPYGEIKTDVVSRDVDGIYVATSRDCPPWMADDAADYQAWIAAGNTPSPPAPLPAPPLTPRQLRLWLSRNGIKGKDVEAKIDELPEDRQEEARIEWEYGVMFDRDNPLVAVIGGMFNLSDLQITAGFSEAATF